MRDECCVPNCNSVKRRTNTNFHEFPSTGIREEWIRNICRTTSKGSIDKWEPGDRSIICGFHFDKSAYLEGGKRKRLKKFAVPTVFDCFPTYLQQKIQKQQQTKRKSPVDRQSSSKKVKFDHTNLPERLPESSEDLPEPRDYGRLGEEIVLQEIVPEVKNTKVSGKSIWGRDLCPSKVRAKLKSYTRRVSYLQSQNNKLRVQLSKLTSRTPDLVFYSKVKAIEEDAQNGVKKAIMLREQINCYGSKWHKWSEEVIRYCVLWRAKSPRAYEFIRKANILRLPCASTLKSYLGPMSMELGVTPLIKERLTQVFRNITTIETNSSLIFDEMGIKPMCKFVRHADRLIGRVSFGGYIKPRKFIVANRFLCFVLKGLCSSDDVELMFSGLRQMCGYNDQTNALNAIYGMEKTLKIGMIAASESANVTLPSSMNLFSEKFQKYLKEASTTDNDFNYTNKFLLASVEALKSPKDIEEITPKQAGVSMVAGFLCRLIQDQLKCAKRLDYLVDENKNSTLNRFIHLQDRGGLLYPSRNFLSLVCEIVNVFDKFNYFLKKMPNVTSELSKLCLPNTSCSGIVKCGCGDSTHSKNMLSLIFRHLVKLYFVNTAADETAMEDLRPKYQNKPLSRKILKV